MRQAKLQVLGLCRWSYPSQTGAFNNTGESLEALQSELYAAGRMAVRLFFLGAPCLAKPAGAERPRLYACLDDGGDAARAMALACA